MVLFFSCVKKQPFNYEEEHLKISEKHISDSLRTITYKQLPNRSPVNTSTLKGVNKLTHKLWDIALTDIESNIIETKNGRYFGAGKKFGLIIYTRDISYSGILGLNILYPNEMLSSLKVTRETRLNLGFRVPEKYVTSKLDIPWQPEPITEGEFVRKYHTNNFLRRTDDVIWLWAAEDLFNKNPNLADWQWLYDNGVECFKSLYKPFYDASDGLYRGQASFIDIHFEDNKASGYPEEFSIADCVLIKPISTNCLYYKGLLAMANVCEILGKSEESIKWKNQAISLKKAINENLKFEDGTFSYFKNQDGTLAPRREALGTALAVLTGVVEDDEAKKALKSYPESWSGIPLFTPFYPWERSYHNKTSWPFVDTFFLWAKEVANSESFSDKNAALIARTCVKEGSFHELVDWTTKEPIGSGSQLWSASSFVNVCLRNNLVNIKTK
ncbi:MGH1-like glycoside hydrolase domain-containing protein [Tamlana sp. I1]|uniref:MGH1-like glycoside hydrolase domain-containing protein n=1 Tax=Tamlana sp. I1 TaxID=2762061 RepID=UPI00188E9140|nr:hypothetical protein [Tamlana sp. I1]